MVFEPLAPQTRSNRKVATSAKGLSPLMVCLLEVLMPTLVDLQFCRTMESGPTASTGGGYNGQRNLKMEPWRTFRCTVATFHATTSPLKWCMQGGVHI